MSFGGKSEGSVVTLKLVETETNMESSQEGDCSRRRKLWTTALQQSSGNEEKANALYSEYIARMVLEEADAARALLDAPYAALVDDYMSGMEQKASVRRKKKNDVPQKEVPRRYSKKECYKCRKVVPLNVQECPKCGFNSFVFYS